MVNRYHNILTYTLYMFIMNHSQSHSHRRQYMNGNVTCELSWRYRAFALRLELPEFNPWYVQLTFLPRLIFFIIIIIIIIII